MSEQGLSKKQKIINIIIAAVIIIPIIMMTMTIINSKNMIIEQLTELNNMRENAFVEIRPVLMRYRDDHNAFPDKLDKLVPDYISSVPVVLQPYKTPEYDSEDMSIEYISDGETAAFHYRKGYDHTPIIIYDVMTNSYSYKKDTIEADQ